jgi:hypothetical protein
MPITTIRQTAASRYEQLSHVNGDIITNKAGDTLRRYYRGYCIRCLAGSIQIPGGVIRDAMPAEIPAVIDAGIAGDIFARDDTRGQKMSAAIPADSVSVNACMSVLGGIAAGNTSVVCHQLKVTVETMLTWMLLSRPSLSRPAPIHAVLPTETNLSSNWSESIAGAWLRQMSSFHVQ